MRVGSETIFQKDSIKSATHFAPVQELQAAQALLIYSPTALSYQTN
jgi:hypothetical protein